MLVVNTEFVPGYRVVRILGMVSGNTVRAKHMGKDIGAAFKNLMGGELKAYTELLTESRTEAMSRLIAEAQKLGANAVLNVRLGTSSIAAGAAEICAYGTAAVVEPE